MSTKVIGEEISAYHRNGAISCSKLKDFMDSCGGSPLRFYHRHIAKIMPGEVGEHFDIGNAFHLLMEDAEKYKAAVVDAKFDNYRTNEAKKWRDEQQAAGRIILTKDQADALSAMHGRVLKHRVVQELIAGTEAEVTWRKSFGEYAVQCRTDRYRDGVIVDWKTIPSIASFRKDVVTYGYHIQAEFYRLVIAACLELAQDAPLPRVVFVAVEKEPPHEVQPFEIDAESLAVARSEIILALKHLKRCFATNQWDRREEIETVRLPNWHVHQAEERLMELRSRLELNA